MVASFSGRLHVFFANKLSNSLSLSLSTLIPAKTAEPIEMPSIGQTGVGTVY